MHIAYTRSHDGADMIEIAPGIAVNRDYFIAAAPVAPKPRPKVEPVAPASLFAGTPGAVSSSMSARPLREAAKPAEAPPAPAAVLSKPLAKAARYYAGIGRRHAAIAKELGCTVEAVRKAIAS